MLKEPHIAPNPAAAICPACNCARHRTVLQSNRHGHFEIELCAGCGLAFALPRPTPQQLREFYSSTYFKRNASASVGYVDYRSVAEFNAGYMWRQLRSDPLLTTLPAKSLLDVGCATGAFLAGASADGFQTMGIELSSEAVEVARNEFNLRVIQGHIDSPELAGHRFGLITLWHVLEHVLDPRDTLQHAAKLLLPNGVILIELPNWNSAGRLVRGEKWSALTPPEHINFFTPRSLSAAVSSVGLTDISVATRYPSIFNHLKVPGRKRLRHFVAAGAGLLACAAGCGGYVRLTARKAAN